MKETEPILSICIPTWNRSKFLTVSLESFLGQIKEIDPEEIELFVSDNGSDDDTADVVQSFIEKGLPITYNRNPENVGAARNFLKCMQMSSGKYILLLGDDDILDPGALKTILDALRDKEYGIVHLHHFKNVSKDYVEYNSIEDFFMQVSYWFTFVSGSIFRHDVIAKVDAEKYLDTRLMQVPFFLQSALSIDRNLLINKPVLTCGLDYATNGGYNFYEVFVRNYLNIWKELVDNGSISKRCYNVIKKDIYLNFVKLRNYQLLVKHNGVKEQQEAGWSRNGFTIEGAKDILREYYGCNLYYHWSMFKLFIRKLLSR